MMNLDKINERILLTEKRFSFFILLNRELTIANSGSDASKSRSSRLFENIFYSFRLERNAICKCDVYDK